MRHSHHKGTPTGVDATYLLSQFWLHAAHAKRGMAERLEAAEGALMALAQEDLMVALVHAKLALAQKDWANLEAQVRGRPSNPQEH